MARKYEMRSRAAAQEATRRRIVEATVELHGSVGPARTEVSAVAARAGVERVTVYRHFPRPELLLAACSQHYRSLNPPPDPAAFLRVRDPEERLARALDAVFAYYEANEPMMSNVLRDAEVMPVGAGFLALQEAMAGCLERGWNVRGRRRARVAAAARLAVDFHAWRLLARGRGLARADAVALGAALVVAAAR